MKMPTAPPDWGEYHNAVCSYVQGELDDVFSTDVFVGTWGAEENFAGLVVGCSESLEEAVRREVDRVEDSMNAAGHTVAIVVRPQREEG